MAAVTAAAACSLRRICRGMIRTDAGTRALEARILCRSLWVAARESSPPCLCTVGGGRMSQSAVSLVYAFSLPLLALRLTANPSSFISELSDASLLAAYIDEETSAVALLSGLIREEKVVD